MKKDQNATENKIINKKKNNPLRFFLSVIIILGLGYVIFNYVPFVAKYDHYVIVSGSMEPVIMTGDVVIIDTSVTAEEIEIGQIIAFHADINEDGTDEIVVHYFHSVTEVDGETIYNTKPEVSDNLDPWDLTADDIVGIHVLTISKIGPLLLFFESTIGKIVLVVDIGIIYLLMEMFSTSNKNKKEKNEMNLENPEDKK